VLAGACFRASGELPIAILKTYIFQCLPIKVHGPRGPANTRLKPWDHIFVNASQSESMISGVWPTPNCNPENIPFSMPPNQNPWFWGFGLASVGTPKTYIFQRLPIKIHGSQSLANPRLKP